MQNLYFASHWYHKSRLENEGALRRANGFELQMLDREALVARFGIDAPVGPLTSGDQSQQHAFVSEPVSAGLGLLRRTQVWESSRPYLYMRSSADDRLLVGGEDDGIDVPLRRDMRVERKARKLLARIAALFPALLLKVAFAWAGTGTFAETEGGLPFFGPHEQHGPRVHFAMAYGGNGITYSLIGAELLRDSLLGKHHPCEALFGFARLKRR